MSFGITAKNADNDVLIDQDYRALRVFSQGQVDASTGLGSVPLSGVIDPVVFIQPKGFKVTGGEIDGADYNFFVDSSIGVVKYAVCSLDTSGGVGGSEPGLAVFDPQGRTVFSSNRKYMRIIQGWAQTFDFNSTNNFTTESVSRDTGWLAMHTTTVMGGYCNVLIFMAAQRTSKTNMRLSDSGRIHNGDAGPGSTISRTGHFILGELE
jgi:hypothetical protein